MSRWFRMYEDVLDDPKVQRLPAPIFKAWVNLLCLASRGGGKLPCFDDIAFCLRINEDELSNIMKELEARGLIDSEDGIARPHNWDRRQFKSDKDETASERKRAQREREKTQNNVTDDLTSKEGESISNVTENVTRDKPVTSRPPDTDTDTEQSRAEQTERAPDPKHWKEVEGFLQSRNRLNDWEIDFLHSVKWEPSLTTAQSRCLKAIREKLLSITNEGQSINLFVVTRGTEAYEAWINHYRQKFNGKVGFYEGRESITVPSEYPPQEVAA